jgi:hypothetical protein
VCTLGWVPNTVNSVTVVADLFFERTYLEIFQIALFVTYQGASVIMRRVLDRNSLNISMFDWEVVSQS